MNITLEKTRIVIKDYTEQEMNKIKKMVSTQDKIFLCIDSDYNVIYVAPGLFEKVKKMFPKASIEDKSNENWPYAMISPVEHSAEPRNQLQKDFISYLLTNAPNGKKVAGILSPGQGKALPINTKIPTPAGYIRLGDLEVGDKVFGSDGKPITVTGVYDQGVRDVYKITFSDGRHSLCDLEHQWSVLDNENKRITLTTNDLIKDYSQHNEFRFKLPTLKKAVEYNHQILSLHPTLLGKWMNENLDDDTKSAIHAFMCTLSIPDYRNECIPDKYKYTSEENRLELLKGLNKNETLNNFEFNTKSKQISEDVVEVLRSLGFDVNVVENDGFKITSHCEISELPLEIVNIEKVTKDYCRCISVDAEDECYLTQDFIITHNTFMACYSAIKVGQRTLIVVPTSNIRQQWVDTLVKMFNVPKEKVLMVNRPSDFLHAKADFVVVSHSSLALLYKKYNLEQLMKENYFGIKVIDEVQMWFHNILKIDSSSNIRNNWYLTGTFGRSGEEENALYQEMFGDLNIFREKEKPKTLFNRNPGNIYGMKPHMYTTMVWTKSRVLDNLTLEQKTKLLQSWKYSEISDKWSRIGLNVPLYTSYVIPEDGTVTKFLKVLLDTVKLSYSKVDYGKTLVLVPTISSVNTVSEKLKEILPSVKIGTIHSRNTPRENTRAKAESDLIVSTAASVGTGFDLPGLSRLINGQQIKSWILTDQISGRLRRRPDGKPTYMWDIVDATIPQLRAWAKVRAEVLKRKSIDFKVIDM